MYWIVVLSCLLLHTCHGTLVSSPTVACPDDRITFTCTLPGDSVNWRITPVIGNTVSSFANTLNVVIQFGPENFVFEIVLIDVSGGNATSTLTTVTEVSLLEGAMVTCDHLGGPTKGPLTITVAGPPSIPENIRTGPLSEQGINSSAITLQWDHSTTVGVSVRYILSILPPPLSGSQVIVETTSVVITVQYNTLYNITIRAENCAGISNSFTTVFELVACPWPVTPDSGVMITCPPSAPVVGSTLTFTCNAQFMVSTCDSEGRWFEDPENYVCATKAPPVTCAPPNPPVNGSIVGSVSGSSPEGTVINYRCKNGLFPLGDLPSTCSNDGIWNPNPQSQLCSPEPFTCTVPEAPTNGFVVLTTSNTTIVFGCNEGFSPQQNRTANCVDMDQWSSLPAEIVCMVASSENTPVPLSTGAVAGITFAVSAVVFTIFGFLAGVAVTYLLTHKKAVYSPTEGQANVQPTVPAGPVYEDVLPTPKEEIELKTNDAYGPTRR